MTVFEFALFRYAAQRMTPDEMALAKDLEELADHGNPVARAEFRNLALQVIANEPKANNI